VSPPPPAKRKCVDVLGFLDDIIADRNSEEKLAAELAAHKEKIQHAINSLQSCDFSTSLFTKELVAKTTVGMNNRLRAVDYICATRTVARGIQWSIHRSGWYPVWGTVSASSGWGDKC
jgi:hypothetical protein